MRTNRRLLITLLLITTFISGCSPHTYRVRGDLPQNASQYRKALIKWDMLVEPQTITVNFKTLKKRLTKASKQCYKFQISHNLNNAETHKEAYTGSVAQIGKNILFFTMQTKGLSGTKVVFEKGKQKVPKNGIYVYGIEFTKAGRNKINVRAYTPTGWKKPIKAVMDIAQNKLRTKCPAKSSLFPNAY